MTRAFFTPIRLLRYSTWFLYLATGLPLASEWASARLTAQHFSNTNIALVWWSVCYLIFGLVYWLLTRRLGSRRYLALKLLGLTVITCMALAIGWYSHSGLAAMLMMVDVVVLPWLLPLPVAVVWMVLQNIAFVPVFASFPEYSKVGVVKILMQELLYLAMSTLALITSIIASQQAEERERQRQLNSELRATRALLAESSRIAERIRIARELHDLVGHHLTALTLNLEVASHLASEPAAGHVRKAQTTAKHLLADVREVVSEMRQDDALDLTQALHGLIDGVPALDVQMELPPRFAVEDPQRAQVVLRCVQEIVTNAVRHAQARHLWLNFERTAANEVHVVARDDGRGAVQVNPGNGLSGMRERLAEFGGRLEIATGYHRGFKLEAWLPLAPEVGYVAEPEPPSLPARASQA